MRWFKRGANRPSLFQKRILKVVTKLKRLEQMQSAYKILSAFLKYGSLFIAFVKAAQALKDEMEKEMKPEELEQAAAAAEKK